MKHLVIIGAGGYGREMYGAALGSVGYGTEFDVKGYLDGNADALNGFAGYPSIIGSPETYVPESDDVFITALGSLSSRRHCVKLIAERGGQFISIVHRTAFLGPNVMVGVGSFVAHNVVLTADVHVGEHVAVFHNASIGHDTVLEDYSHVYALCSLGGSVRLGEGAIVYPGSVVTPRKTIGAGAVVGAGSTVLLNVRDGVTVFGSPAKPVA